MEEKIQEMFMSKDQEMRRLGQKLCHQFRISYWIAVGKAHWGERLNHKFSLIPFSEIYKENSPLGVMHPMLYEDYKIELCKRK